MTFFHPALQTNNNPVFVWLTQPPRRFLNGIAFCYTMIIFPTVDPVFYKSYTSYRPYSSLLLQPEGLLREQSSATQHRTPLRCHREVGEGEGF